MFYFPEIAGKQPSRLPWSRSITDQFWQYAKEALLSASYAKAGDDRQGLLELPRTWMQAALQERQSSSIPLPVEYGQF